MANFLPIEELKIPLIFSLIYCDYKGTTQTFSNQTLKTILPCI